MSKRESGDDAGQLLIDWTAPPSPADSEPAPAATETDTHSGLHLPPLELPWNFRTTFPEPTEEAIDAGLIDGEDAQPHRVRAIHAEHERELAAALRMLDGLQNARRRGVDVKTGRRPKSPEKQDALYRQLSERIDDTERWWTNLMSVYADSFGGEAAEAFGQAIKARHAGVHVKVSAKVFARAQDATPIPGERSTTPAESHRARIKRRKATANEANESVNVRRVSASFPVPKPLPECVAAGRFGHDERGPVRPSAEEVREITDTHAHQLIELLDDLRAHPPGHDGRMWHEREYARKIEAYAEDFGTHAAERLDAYCRRQDHLHHGESTGRSGGR